MQRIAALKERSTAFVFNSFGHGDSNDPGFALPRPALPLFASGKPPREII
jgi:hypothetical protein